MRKQPKFSSFSLLGGGEVGAHFGVTLASSEADDVDDKAEGKGKGECEGTGLSVCEGCNKKHTTNQNQPQLNSAEISTILG